MKITYKISMILSCRNGKKLTFFITHPPTQSEHSPTTFRTLTASAFFLLFFSLCPLRSGPPPLPPCPSLTLPGYDVPICRDYLLSHVTRFTPFFFSSTYHHTHMCILRQKHGDIPLIFSSKKQRILLMSLCIRPPLKNHQSEINNFL